MNQEIQRKLKSNIWKFYTLAILFALIFVYEDVFSLYFRSFSLSFSEIGFIIMVSMFATLILEIPTGAFADIYGRKSSILIGGICYIISLAILAFGSKLIIFIFASLFIGSAMAFFSGAYNALIYESLKELKKEKDYMKFLVREESIFLSFTVLTAFLGPYLFSFNIRFPFYLALFISFSWFILALSLYEPEFKRKKLSVKNHYIQMREGFKFTLGHSKILWLIFVSIILSAVTMFFGGVVEGPFIIEELGFTLKQWAVIAAISNLIQAIMVFNLDKFEKKIGEKNSFLLVFLGIAFNLILIALSKNYFIILFLALFWIMTSFKGIIIDNYMQHYLKKENRATVSSIHSMIISLAGLISLPILGGVADKFSVFYTLIGMGVFILISGLILMFVRCSKSIWRSLD